MGTCYNEAAPHYYQALALIKMQHYKKAEEKFETVIGKFQHSKFATLASINLNRIKSKNFNQQQRSEKGIYNQPDFIQTLDLDLEELE